MEGKRPQRAADDTIALGAGARSAADFRRAHRNARRVRILRITLPIVAVGIVAAGLFATWLARSVPVDIAVAATSIQDGRLVMEDPRMSGKDKNDRPFTCLLYTSPSPRDRQKSRMPSSA